MTCACEYVNVTGKGAPIPIAGSFSYSVTDLGIGELTSLIHEQAGMHWRHHNAACVCAIIAQLRSAA